MLWLAAMSSQEGVAMLERRGRILLGVTGCIAAYKACEILRLLQKDGYEVRVVMTDSARRFVGETTFDALSGHQTLFSMFGDSGHPIPHIELAEWCDSFLIAPCTADMAAKVASGIADDLLSSTALAAWQKLAIAPAMNVHMYESPAVQSNLETLRRRGVGVIEPASGRLACGDVGRGKLASPEDVVAAFKGFMGGAPAVSGCDAQSAPAAFDLGGIGENEGACAETALVGKKVLVTAGPTHERIDDVRYVANRSSGKMGYALACAARDMGASVTLVSGPVALEDPDGVCVICVESALEMLHACEGEFADSDLTICAAAVADFRPSAPHAGKLKKSAPEDLSALQSIAMEETADILAELCKAKQEGQIVVGFAAEATDLIENASAKLERKGADAIVANDVSGGQVFGEDDNVAFLVSADGVKEFSKMSKNDLAFRIIENICAKML